MTRTQLADKISRQLADHDSCILTVAEWNLVVDLLRESTRGHDWQMKSSGIPAEMFKNPIFCADALRKMVSNCVALHASGKSLYTEGERRVMLASAEHIENMHSSR